MRQKTLRVFEVDNFNNLKNVVESKYELIKNYFFMLKESNEEIESYLRNKGLNFFVLNTNKNFFKPIEEKIKIIEKVVEKEIVKEVNTSNIFDRIIRSGEELSLKGTVVFLNRINPGAKIEIDGNLILLNENNGLIRVEGEFALIKKNNSHIFFNYEEIGKIDKLTFFYKDKRLEI